MRSECSVFAEYAGMLLSAIHNVNGEEKLNLVMLDDAIPAGAKLY
jgi:tRNA-binding protein